MSSRASFAEWLVSEGYVSDAITFPADAGYVGVSHVLTRHLAGPNSVAAFHVWFRLAELSDAHSAATGTPRLVGLTAQPIGDAARRGLAGVLAEAS